MLLDHDLFWQTKSACVGGVCYVGSLEQYSIQNWSLTGMQYGYGTLGNIVHLLNFAGALGLKFFECSITTNYEGLEGLEGSLDAIKLSVWIG